MVGTAGKSNYVGVYPGGIAGQRHLFGAQMHDGIKHR